jgi:hypothetical protein
MTTKITRGQLVVFTSTPKDAHGNEVIPAHMHLYLDYKHADGVARSDKIEMLQQTDGSLRAAFDTAAAFARRGFCFGANRKSAGLVRLKFYPDRRAG